MTVPPIIPAVIEKSTIPSQSLEGDCIVPGHLSNHVPCAAA
jgi:hypothetical protein